MDDFSRFFSWHQPFDRFNRFEVIFLIYDFPIWANLHVLHQFIHFIHIFKDIKLAIRRNLSYACSRFFEYFSLFFIFDRNFWNDFSIDLENEDYFEDLCQNTLFSGEIGGQERCVLNFTISKQIQFRVNCALNQTFGLSLRIGGWEQEISEGICFGVKPQRSAF